MKHSRLLLADCHLNMLDALRSLLKDKFTTTVMVADEASLLDTVELMTPDLVVLDLSLPVSGNVNAALSLCGRHPGLPVIVLSVHDEWTALMQVLGAGAMGFVLKRTVAADLAEAVDTVLRGEKYVSAALGWRPEQGSQN